MTCEICGEAPAKLLCPSCGRRVCPRHIAGGRCTICSQATCRICRINLAVTYCMICGRLGCTNCLIQLDNVRRVCRDCLPRARALGWPSRGAVRLYSLGARRLTHRVLESALRVRGNIPQVRTRSLEGV